MPPLLCASSFILDQTFPRDEGELNLVSDALGVMEEVVRNNDAHLILTDTLQKIVEEFDWQRTGPYPLLRTIYDLLNQWFLLPHDRLIKIDLTDIQDHQPHPLLCGCQTEGLSEIWADELGKLLIIHDACCAHNNFFIGVACAFAFSGEQVGEYNNPNNQRVFPLVGPNDIDQRLIDAYEWDIPNDLHQRNISFDDAYNNCHAIGAVEIVPPTRGSHYSVRFKGAHRPWQLDPNSDPVPERYLRQLVGIVGYPIEVIKYALLHGELPERVIRFNLH